MKVIGIDARFLLRPMRGIPLYVLRLCQLLPSLDTDVKFIYFINKAYEHNELPSNYMPIIEGIQNKNLNVEVVNYDSEGEIYWEQIVLPKLCKKYKIDLLHMPGNRTCFLSKVPTIVTVHDIIEYREINREKIKYLISNILRPRRFFYLSRIAAYLWFTYRVCLDRSQHLLTVSNYSANDLVNCLNINPEKISAIHHGVDSDFLVEKPDSFEKRKFVLMLGGDSPHKNPEGAISAWAKVPLDIRRKFPLKIIGFCGGDKSPLIHSLKKNRLEEEVEIKGWVSKESLIEHLGSAAVFIYLSRYEGFGFPPLQSMAAGTPVVASNCTSIPEVLGPVGLTFDPDDHQNIAKGITSILRDAGLWQQEVDSGLKRANEFKWQTSVEKHFEIYKSHLGKKDVN